MTTHNSTPPKPRNLDPVADAMRRANLSTPNARATAAGDVVARWKASLGVSFDPSEDFGDFVAWEDEGTIDRVKMVVSDDYRAGFNRYCGEPWARRTEAGWYYEQSLDAYTLEGFTLDEQRIIRSAFNDEWIDSPARRWLLLEDKTKTAPINLPEVDPATFATTYRAGLPEPMRELAVVVGLEAGRPVHVAVWLGDDARAPREIRAWLATFNESGRLTRLDHTPRRAWTAIAPVQRLVPTARKAAFTIHTTGIAPLDALLATEGIPRGARVYVQAATGHGKSVFDLQIGDHFADDGLRVALIATSDESAESITARRLQRIMKLDRKTALMLAMGDDDASIAARAKLNANLTIVDGATTYLEDVIASAPALVICDPIQKIRTRAGGGDTYTLDSTAAAVRVAEQSGITFVCASSKVKRAGRDLEASFGGASIPNGATLMLDLERHGTTVNVRVLKSRYGGEGESFDVELDADRQTLAPCHGTPAPVSEVEADRRARILDVLAKGPKTARALRTWVAGHNKEIAAALEALVTAGKVVLNGNEYALKDPA